MAGVICSCGNPKFPNLNRPNCVIEMKAIAFVILVPRFKADGVTRNTFDVSSVDVGQNFLDLIPASVDPESRIYPFPRCENVSFERTDTVYETAASTRKYKIDGVGGVRTMKIENWSKEAVHQLLREYKKVGCTDVDMLLIDVAGTIWGIKESVDSPLMRGYEVATETFDSFKEYATDTTTQKIMTSWDFDNAECEENSYGITAEELGFKATTIKGNQSAFQDVTVLTNVTLQTDVLTGFGTANVRGVVTGLVQANFTVENLDVPGGDIVTGVVENPLVEGEYIVTTSAQTVGENHRISVIDATGYDVDTSDFVAIA